MLTCSPAGPWRRDATALALLQRRARANAAAYSVGCILPQTTAVTKTRRVLHARVASVWTMRRSLQQFYVAGSFYEIRMRTCH